MKIRFLLVASMLAGAPFGAASADRQSAIAEPPYKLPEKAVALKDTARDVVLSAKTIAMSPANNTMSKCSASTGTK